MNRARPGLGNGFVIVVPVWNASRAVERCLESLFAQDHPDLGVIIRDDLSDDDTAARIARRVGVEGTDEHRARVGHVDVWFERNSQKLHPCGNTYRSVCDLVWNPDAIVGVVDGDDYLLRGDTAALVERHYAGSPSVWMLWTQHRTTSGAAGCSQPMPPADQLGRTRVYWAASHFRTARAWLYRRVAREDLSDPRGNSAYVPLAGDAALLFPMMEMAGHAHTRFVDVVCYHYDDALPTNEARLHGDLASWYARWVRESQRRYRPLSPE